MHSPKLWTDTIEEIVDRRNKAGVSVTVAKIQKELSEKMKNAGVTITGQTLTRLLIKMGYIFDDVRKTRNFEETPEIQTWSNTAGSSVRKA